jgi:hypothetical protein
MATRLTPQQQEAVAAFGGPLVGSSGSTFRLGAIPGLPPQSLAGDSAQHTLLNLEGAGSNAAGIPYVVVVANYLTGQDWGKNVSGAENAVYKALGTYGAMPGGVYANVDPGTFNVSSGRGSKSGSGGAGAFVVGGAGGGDYGLSAATASAKLSALDQLDSDLYAWGLNSLKDWVYNEVMAPGDFKPTAQVIMDMRNTPEYQARFPGMALRAQAGLTPITEADYIKNETAYMATANQYGIASIMTPTEIGILIGHDVSPQQLNDRVINAYQVAANADPNTQALLKNYYGIDTGQLAAYYLDPTKAYNTLLKQTQSAVIGGISEDTGFGNLSKNTAETLAAQAINSPTSMDSNYFRTQFGKIAPLTPLEQAQTGQRGQATATQQQLLGQAFAGLNQTQGTTPAGDAAAVKLAEQAKVAGLAGGGGYTTNQKGVVGVGSASTTGAASSGP